MSWIGQLLNGRDECIPPGLSHSPRQAAIPLTPSRAPVPHAPKYEHGGFRSLQPIQHNESPTEHASQRIPAPPSPYTNPQKLLPLIMPNHPTLPNMLTGTASYGQPLPLAFRPATSASTRSTISSLSTSTRRDSLISSSASTTASTAASTVASTVLDYDYNYELPCEFEYLGCDISFHPDQFEEWILHSVSHFGTYGPPPKTICLFCDKAPFGDKRDAFYNWRERMLHIGDHFRHQVRQDSARPDFLVIEYMRKKHLISQEDYAWATRYTERHHCDGLVPLGYMPPELRRKEEKSKELPHDLEKEDRHRRRESAGRGKEKSKSIHYPATKATRSLNYPSRSRSTWNASLKDTNRPPSIPAQSKPQPSKVKAGTAATKPRTLPLEKRRHSASPANETVAEFRSEAITTHVSLMEKSTDSVSTTYSESSAGLLSEVQLVCFQSNPTEESAIVSRSNSLTDSTCSEDETDWEVDSDEDMANMHNSFNPQGIAFEDSLIQSRLTPAKAQLVDRLMEEFWVIFSQVWKANIQHRGSESASASGSPSKEAVFSQPISSDSKGTKRSRRNADDGSDDNNGRRSKRGGSRSEPLDMTGNSVRFACPYRKNNPRKYCIQRYKHCALNSHATVARVKAHLYTYHSINQCERCKDLFSTVKELEGHTVAESGCPSRTAHPVDGITRKIKEQLQCRKKAYPGQTESERWAQIYEILFGPKPDDVTPSPYFEQIRDLEEGTNRSPDSRGLANYEDYLRRELPRFFNSVLQNAVGREVQPIEERLRGQMMSFLEEAQNRAFSSYRAILSPTPDSELAPPGEERMASDAITDRRPTAILERFYQPPAPQMDSESLLDMSDFGKLNPRDNEGGSFSDSGFFSNASGSASSQHATNEADVNDLARFPSDDRLPGLASREDTAQSTTANILQYVPQDGTSVVASQQRCHQQGLADMTASEPLYPERGDDSSMYGGAFMQAPPFRDETLTDTFNDTNVDFINWDVLPHVGAAEGP